MSPPTIHPSAVAIVLPIGGHIANRRYDPFKPYIPKDLPRLNPQPGTITMRRQWMAYLAAIAISGPAARSAAAEPFHSYIRKHLVASHDPSPAAQLAREITLIEEDLRATGTITIKEPDVWGETDLMSYLQEYEAELLRTVGSFSATTQAYVARADLGDAQVTAALGQGLGSTTAPSVPTATPISFNTNSGGTTSVTPFNTLNTALGSKSPASPALEPTESERQHSNYVKVNQQLRRLNQGDDNSRRAGYALYLFRLPVSVLPGRETFEGHAAVVNVRARLAIDEHHLQNTFPKLVIAEVVDDLAGYLQQMWCRAPVPAADLRQKVLSRAEFLSTSRSDPEASRAANTSAKIDLYGADNLNNILVAARAEVPTPVNVAVPSQREIREFLFALFARTQLAMEAAGLYESGAECILTSAEAFTRNDCAQFTLSRQAWLALAKNLDCSYDPTNSARQNPPPVIKEASWCLAAKAGQLDWNIKRLLQGGPGLSATEGDLSALQFFSPHPQPDALAAWESLVRRQFPLHVFTIDQVIEEQNVYDAFTRRRNMQFALAYALAAGNINASAALAFSRQLDLDVVAQGLNRTTVGFAHSNDTFGWYFYPRVQSPPPERSNIVAFGRLLWSTGPTQHYDQKHQKLEPGMRECQVLIAMPSFVPGVTFDVTTNWERLTKPGCVKRTYEEMLDQGCMVTRARAGLRRLCNAAECRPGDIDRLISRLDQLEEMLPLQTHSVAIPYDFELPGSELLGTGNEQLRPAVEDYYGIRALPGGGGQFDVFLVGRHFHPTQTFVVAAGAASAQTLPTIPAAGGGGAGAAPAATPAATASYPRAGGTAENTAARSITRVVALDAGSPQTNPTAPQPNPAGLNDLGTSVKVLSRELLLVRVNGVNNNNNGQPFSWIALRVATPAGVANELLIPNPYAIQSVKTGAALTPGQGNEPLPYPNDGEVIPPGPELHEEAVPTELEKMPTERREESARGSARRSNRQERPAASGAGRLRLGQRVYEE